MKIFKSTFIALLVLPFVLFSCSNEDSNGNEVDYGQHDQSNYPAGYYKSAEGQTKEGLKTALYEIVKDHRVRTYTQLWTDFRSTDVKSNGRVWDIYNNQTNYIFGDDQDRGGGDANTYNREHTFPKSWFRTGGNNDYTRTPMYTDLFHLYPSDSYANTKRSNNYYYEVQKESWSNGYCRLGTAVIPGYGQETVFEPNDDIKGDLARTYFYFATRYENENMNAWAGSKAITKTKYPFYSGWQLSTLIKWHRQDPVSQKEIKRNEEIYKIQGNRNPYIDCPVLVEYIWGDRMGKPFEGSK
ncbi:MAG: endonuclease I family protein [Bacteroidales bacterium]